MPRKKPRNRFERLAPVSGAGLLAVWLATGAFADPLLASNPGTFADFFFDEGVPAILKTSDDGNPMIEFREDGRTYPLFFKDCLEGADYLSVQFYAAYEMDAAVSMDTMNAWNSEGHRFTRAYFTAENNAVHLEMDIATSKDGISARDFNDLLRLWLDRVNELEEFIGW